MEDKLEEREPVGRCRTFFVHKDHFYVCQGQKHCFHHAGYSEDQLLLLQPYDFTLAQWRGEACPQCVCVDKPEEKEFTREFIMG